MERKELDYNNLDIVSRKFAGHEGFDIRHTGDEIVDETIITIYVSDPQLLASIDQALKENYEVKPKEEKE